MGFLKEWAVQPIPRRCQIYIGEKQTGEGGSQIFPLFRNLALCIWHSPETFNLMGERLQMACQRSFGIVHLAGRYFFFTWVKSSSTGVSRSKISTITVIFPLFTSTAETEAS